MAEKRISGKLLTVGIDGAYLDCQTSASLNITTNTSESEACKPANGESDEISWTEITETSKTWSISVSAQAFDQIVTAAERTNNLGITDKLINGSAVVEVVYGTNSSLENGYVYTGEGIITNYTETGDVEGNATYDLEIQGNGALVRTIVTA